VNTGASAVWAQRCLSEVSSGGVRRVPASRPLLCVSGPGRTGRLDGSSRPATDRNRVATPQVLHEAGCPETAGVRAAATTTTTLLEVCRKSCPHGHRCHVMRHAGDARRRYRASGNGRCAAYALSGARLLTPAVRSQRNLPARADGASGSLRQDIRELSAPPGTHHLPTPIRCPTCEFCGAITRDKSLSFRREGREAERCGPAGTHCSGLPGSPGPG